MPYDSRIHHRRSIRLSGWDYSADGAYFVTVCTNRRVHMFGEIVDGQMGLNAVGSIVAEASQWLATQYPFVALDEWCVMPNHLHGILVLTGRGGSRTAPTPHSPDDDTADAATVNGHATTTPRKPVGRLIGAFKTVSTKHINQLRDMPAAVVWQRNFWERVVRDDAEMDRFRAYIGNNAINWASDGLNDAVGAVREPPLRDFP